MIRQSARTGRTCPASRSQREVIHAQGHSGSNQNGTSSRSGCSLIIRMGTVLSQTGCAYALSRRRLDVEQSALDGHVAPGRAARYFHQIREIAELSILVRGADEPEEHLRGDIDVGVGPVAIRRLRDGEMRQQRVEFVVRQTWDEVFGERDRVKKVNAGQRRAVLALVVYDVGLGGGVLSHQQVPVTGRESPV